MKFQPQNILRIESTQLGHPLLYAKNQKFRRVESKQPHREVADIQEGRYQPWAQDRPMGSELCMASIRCQSRLLV